MAAANSAQFSKMVLVGATGLRPPQGEIMDMFIVTARAYLNKNVVDTQGEEFRKLFGGEQTPEQYEAWEDARAETARIAWKPYMFTQSMSHLLGNVVGLPTLLVWGKQAKITPISDAAAFLAVTDSHPDSPGFDGWMLQDEPSLSMMQHPIYDLRVTGCT